MINATVRAQPSYVIDYFTHKAYLNWLLEKEGSAGNNRVSRVHHFWLHVSNSWAVLNFLSLAATRSQRSCTELCRIESVKGHPLPVRGILPDLNYESQDMMVIQGATF